jgi:tetratricopeptide (TPR) repeat protein
VDAIPERMDARRLAVWIVVLLLALYLVFVGGGWQGIYTAAIRQVTVALAGLGLGVWAIVALRRPAWRPRSVLLPAVVACLGSLAVSTATSRYPRFGVEYVGYALLLAALYLLLVRLFADPFFRARLGALVVSLCGAISFVYVVLVLRHWIDWWGLVGRITVPPLRPDFESLVWGNPAAVLTITVLLLGPAIAHIGTSTAPARAVVGFLVLMVGAVAVFSGSRAGWLALAVAIAVVGGSWLATGRRWEAVLAASRTAAIPVRTRVAVALAAGLGLVGLLAIAPALVRRAIEGGEDVRAGFLAIAFRLFAEAPLSGTGPGTWVVERIRYTVPPETDYYIPHAHDLYAQTLSELGVVGAAAGIVLVASLAWLVRTAMRDDDPVRRRWGWLTLFALVYFAAHQVFDFYANMPAILFAAVLPVAWLDATTVQGPRILGRGSPVRLGRLPAALAAAVVLVAVAGLEATEIPAALHGRAVALANAGEWVAADVPARDAVAVDPAMPPYLMTEGLTAARLGDHARAADAFRRVAAADDLPEAWVDLAAEEAALGRTAEAREAITNALRLGYQRPAVAMAAGDLALRLGDETTARAAFTAALTVAPSLAGDPWWAADPARAALFPAIRAAAIERLGAVGGWELAMVAGDSELARSLAARLDAPAAAFAARVVAAWEGDAPSMRAVLDECAARPLDVTALSWCARLEGRAGDDVEANRYRAWANTILGGSYAAGAELRVSSTPQVGRSDAGDPALFYGHYTYRRPTPWDLLVPSLVHLTLE